jgi:proton-dependent oligopeptide transporter, POT family
MSFSMTRNHPPGLVVCSLTEMWERFSYYGMRALLVFYLMQHFQFSEQQSYLIYGTYTALVYLTPLIGGAVADRYLGARKAITLGALLLVAGHFGLALDGARIVALGSPGGSSGLEIFYASLALIATGVGFLKTNASALVGALYERDDPRRDAGFTLFYMLYNAGAVIAPLVCGWVGHTYGWHYGFGIAGIGMLAGLIGFLRGQKYLQGYAEPPDARWLEQPVWRLMSRETALYVGCLILAAAVWAILRSQQYMGPLLLVFGLAAGVVILYDAFVKCSPVERDRLLVCATLTVFTVGFWALYEQMGSSLNVFADRVVDRVVLGYEIPAPMLQALPPFFVIALAPFFSALWVHLARRGRDLSTATKFVLALVQISLAFLAVSFGAFLAQPTGKVALGWFVLNFLLLTTGELCLAPVGLAMVTKLSPRRIVGVMMGAFFLAYSASSFLASLIARLTSPTPLGAAGTDAATSLHTYASIYARIAMVALAVAALLLLLSRTLTRRMHSAAAPAGEPLQVGAAAGSRNG